VKLYRQSDSAHGLRGDRSYIETPKPGGYRSHHFVLEFLGSSQDEAIYNGLRIELQIRTRLQHAWATAVEAVGLVRNEDLKAGEGDADWLRLFELMASEIAHLERCPLVPGTPEHVAARTREIKVLDKKLGAASML
jgi:ppGpp synthetase/RelA/SpoT-type nucleotidyltranferase